MGAGSRMLQGKNGRNQHDITNEDVDNLRKQMEINIDLLEQSANKDRMARIAAATSPPQPWQPIESVPKNGTLIDVMFDVLSAEEGMAEFYAPGCTRKKNAADPVIENVAFINGSFKPVIDAAGAKAVATVAGGWGQVSGVAYGITSVTLTAWRSAAFPFIE